MIRKYENWACNVLTCCQESSNFSERPLELVTRVLSNWGNMTCLNLAESSQLLEFLSHSVVKNYLYQKWYGELEADDLISRDWIHRRLEPVLVRQEKKKYNLGYDCKLLAIIAASTM